MKNKFKKTLLVSSFILAMANIMIAQDKATLDLLVTKGVITKEEAAKVSKNAVTVTAKEKAVKGLKFNGRIQTQFESINVTGSGSKEYSLTRDDFIMRRVFLGVEADLGSGWSGTLITDLARGSDGQNYIEYVYITKKIDYDFLQGAVDFGYKKSFFGLEETTSASKLLTVERSIATRYWAERNNNTRLGIGGRYTGVYWNGKTPVKDLDYGLLVANSYNDTFSSYSNTGRVANSVASNIPNFYGCVSYKLPIDGVEIKVGSNFVYSSGGNATYDTVSSKAINGTMYGANPYLTLNYEGLHVWTEFMITNVENAKGNQRQYEATPMGFNVAAEYKFDIGDFGKIAPAVRYSWLNTDGRGTSVSDGIRNTPSGSATYNSGQSIYVGLNWYINGDALKFQLGYEFARFNDVINTTTFARSSGTADANVVRAQVQLLF